MLSKLRVLILAGLFSVVTSAQSFVALNNTLEFFTVGQNDQFFSAAQLNAVGEYTSTVGQVHLAAGSGTKTCSSAGCIIYWNNGGSITFNTASTTVRIGLQDVDPTTGFPDGTYDVHQELVAGTDPAPATSATIAATQESGSKTVTEGDIIVGIITMTVRAGTDALTINRSTSIVPQTYGLPYGVINSGSPAKASSLLPLVIKFDDGTYGWITTTAMLYSLATVTSVTYGNGSTPDEYAALLSFQTDVTVCGFGMRMDNVVGGDTLDYVLYSTPLGTPAAITTKTVNPLFFGATVGVHRERFAACHDLDNNTVYGFSVLPTSANTITIGYQTFTTGLDDVLKAMQPFPTITMATRTNGTGAFTPIASSIPNMSIAISRFVQ